MNTKSLKDILAVVRSYKNKCFCGLPVGIVAPYVQV